MRTLAIIPARGGSKGVPRKNLKLINGFPLIYFTIKSALKADIFSDVIVSTDDPEIAEVSKKYGALVPFIRDSSLSHDTANAVDVIKDSISQMKILFGKHYDAGVMLQPTTPLRQQFHYKETYNQFKLMEYKSLISVCPVSEHPHKMFKIKRNELDLFLDWPISNPARQTLPHLYIPNGAFYYFEINCFLKYETFNLDSISPYVMEKKFSVNIDDNIDFLLAEKMIGLTDEY